MTYVPWTVQSDEKQSHEVQVRMSEILALGGLTATAVGNQSMRQGGAVNGYYYSNLDFNKGPIFPHTVVSSEHPLGSYKEALDPRLV